VIIHEAQWNTLKMNDQAEDDSLWELFHENSKMDIYSPPPAPAEVYKKVTKLYESLPYQACPKIPFKPTPDELTMSLSESIHARSSVRTMSSTPITFDQLGSLLYYSYGVTRSNEGTDIPRPFRATPSAGGLYPLEIYIATSAEIKDIAPGLYHYNSREHCLSTLQKGNTVAELSQHLIQKDIAKNSTLLVMITSLFQRTVFKYKARGYRYALLEAGHLGQNMALVAAALKLGLAPLGGYQDREVDNYLGIDGINHSTLYMAAIGQRDL